MNARTMDDVKYVAAVQAQIIGSGTSMAQSKWRLTSFQSAGLSRSRIDCVNVRATDRVLTVP